MRKFQTDESQQIKELHYNNDTQQMMAFFVNGSAYLYEDVRLITFNSIIGSESVGETFAMFAKETKRYRKVR